jgi:hypothetical protein
MAAGMAGFIHGHGADLMARQPSMAIVAGMAAVAAGRCSVAVADGSPGRHKSVQIQKHTSMSLILALSPIHVCTYMYLSRPFGVHVSHFSLV